MSSQKVYRILAFGDSLTEVRLNIDNSIFASFYLIRDFILLAFVIIRIQSN